MATAERLERRAPALPAPTLAPDPEVPPGLVGRVARRQLEVLARGGVRLVRDVENGDGDGHLSVRQPTIGPPLPRGTGAGLSRLGAREWHQTGACSRTPSG